ncbi:MAG: hypothetical protein GW898_10700 [Thiomicrospira sp.]|nr:hypothetical protein [Thiomicrospira sp.]NCN66372.1 hypothetical protein [Thiomicrospira sp.]NCO14826.1 hypothetical protein [Thiomicrospira sp.]NCO82422.1 hypothetical protein [Thiomicrospira sp.]OIP95448.1 MAG: hypothetical protein AUK56_05255 [Thiomicrospira sp. CG2_30_44_34]
MKTNSKLLVAISVSTIIGVSGCSSTGMTRTDIAEQEANAQEVRRDALVEKQNFEQEQMEAQLSELPTWVLDPPKADETGFYGVGMGTDKNMLNAMRKAKLQAKYEVASTMKSEMSGEDTMNGSGSDQYRYIINNFVDSVDLTGTEVVAQELKPINGEFHSYTLVKMPFAKFNKLLDKDTSQQDRQTLEDSYQRLLKRVEGTEAQVPDQSDEPKLAKE